MSRDIEVRKYLRTLRAFGTGDGADVTMYAMCSCLLTPEAGNVAFVRWLVENDRAFIIAGHDDLWASIITDKHSGDEFRAAGGVFAPMTLPTSALARDGGDRDQ